jgi:hypothetical protein
MAVTNGRRMTMVAAMAIKVVADHRLNSCTDNDADVAGKLRGY